MVQNGKPIILVQLEVLIDTELDHESSMSAMNCLKKEKGKYSPEGISDVLCNLKKGVHVKGESSKEGFTRLGGQ
ncbi:hypothetical protein KI387_019402, partial [Taxus chinensis]